MSILEHFKVQIDHLNTKPPAGDGIERLFFMTDKEGDLTVHHKPRIELEAFLEGTTFIHLAGLIPVFRKPNTGKWKNPLKKEDGKS